MIDFGGWDMPVQYSSIVDEHLAVRRHAGLFDISHMGEVRVTGADALRFLNGILTNDLRKLDVGQAQYTLMCNERGGTIDDLYAYRLGADDYLLVINASRIDADYDWMQSQFARVTFSARLGNVSNEFGALALQGPRAAEFVDRCFSKGTRSVAKPIDLTKNQMGEFSFDGQRIFVARTGYTGEDGFEIIAPAEGTEAVWNRVLAEGHAHCLQPCGLGARDTLRTEMCYPLYGHELDEETSPIEAGVGFFVALDKGDFVGRNVLAQQKSSGVKKKCVAFKMTEKSAPPRPGYPIWSPNGEKIGIVSSGTQSPSLGIGIGLGYVPPEHSKPGTPVEIEIRGKCFPAIVVAKPIYSRKP